MRKFFTWSIVTAFLSLPVVADHSTDFDVPAARERHARAQAAMEAAQEQVNNAQYKVHDSERHYFEALSQEKAAREELTRQMEILHQIEHELPGLHSEVIKLQAELAAHIKDRDQAKTELAALEAQLPPLHSDLAAKKASVASLQSQINAEKAKIAPLQAKLDDLQKKKDQTTSKIAGLQSELQKVQAEINRTKNEIAKTQSEIDQEKAKTGPDAAKIARLEAQVQDNQQMIQQHQTQLSAVTSQISSLQTQLHQKQSELQAEKTKLGPVQAKIEQLETAKANLSHKKNQTLSKISKLQAAITQSENEINRLQNLITQEKAKPHPDKAKIEAWQKKIQQERTEKQQAQKELVEEQNTLSSLNERLTATENQLAQEKAKAAPILQKIATLESEKNAIASQISDLTKQQTSLQNQIKACQTVIAQLQRQIADEKAKPSPDQAKIARLELEKTKLQNKLTNLENQAQQIASAKSALEQDLQKLQSDINEVLAQMSPMQQKVKELLAQKADLETQIRQVEQKIADLNQKIENKKKHIQACEAKIAHCQSCLADVKAKIADHPARLEKQRHCVQMCEHDLEMKIQTARHCEQALNHAKWELQQANNTLDRATQVCHEAYEYLQQVIANYEREKTRILALAQGAGQADGAKEGDERAQDTGRVAGAERAQVVGTDQGTSEARRRDEGRGYAEGRQTASTSTELASFYQAGITQGKAWALTKAQKEDFPKGYNDALARLLAAAPGAEKTVDISETIPADPGGSGMAISAQGKTPGFEKEPAYPLPPEPHYQIPTTGSPSVSVPARDNRYFSPPCTGLALIEFEQMCRNRYDEVYGTGYFDAYRSTFILSFQAGFSENIKAAYDSALAAQFPEAHQTGLKQGAQDQGILDGFAEALPGLQKEQYTAGEKSFLDLLASGNLIASRGAELLETSGDGLFTPGEKVKLSVVFDNYGGQASAKEQFRVRVRSMTGLENLNFQERPLPALDAKTRTTLVGVVTAEVGKLMAGDKITVEAIVEQKDGSGAFVPVATVKAEQIVHFPLELTGIELNSKPQVGESVVASFKFINRTAATLESTPLDLSSSPAVVTVESTDLQLPRLESGQETAVGVQIKPGVWVGENTAVQFISQTHLASKTFVQPFLKRLTLNRNGALLFFDSQGREIPTSTLTARAGSSVSFYVQFKYLREYALGGPFVVHATRTSDPTITHSSGSTTSINYGAAYPGTKYDRVRFSYDIPAALKGTQAWVMIQLSEGPTALHALQVSLDVK
ncbi:MAG: hypothetical protein HY537_09135 [Deltaproteobacteria bacterium]|nr:hypothetical protein [Deltaproteobacteria bacterium]